MQDNQPKSGTRPLVIYLMVVVFACVCSTFVISQRLQVARVGRSISELHDTAVKLRSDQQYLKLRVAEKASYKNLLTKAEEMKLNVVPPEEVKEKDAGGGDD